MWLSVDKSALKSNRIKSRSETGGLRSVNGAKHTPRDTLCNEAERH